MNMTIFLLVISVVSSALATTETKEFESANLSEVFVQNMSGKVVINTTDALKATVTAEKKEFTENCKMTIEKADKRLIVTVEKSGFFSNANCDVNFEMSVPKTVKLDISTGSGDIKTNGTQGPFEFKVGSGNINAEGDFTQIDGKSGSGDVTVKGLSGGGELKTGSGSINLTFGTAKLTGELDIKTGSGKALLLFPKGSQIKSSFKAGSGDLTNELGDTAKASFKVSMKAGSGNLTIKAY